MKNVVCAARGSALLGIVALAVTAGACSSEPTSVRPAPGAALDPTVAEAANASPVMVGWEENLGSPLFVRAGAMRAWLVNQRTVPMDARVYVVALGLDQPAALELATVTLAAGERRVIDVPLDRIPAQSTHAPTAITLMVEADEQGTTKRFPSESLHVAFTPDYARAFASGADAAGPLVAAAAGFDVADARVAQLLAGSRVSTSADAHALVARLEQPAGRVLTPSGAYVDLAARAGSSGLASATLGRALHATAKPGPVTPLSAGGPGGGWRAPPYVKICATYNVSFTDMHYGEDYLADGLYLPLLNGSVVWLPTAIPARFAAMSVYNGNGVTAWHGQLDANGCATMNLNAGAYTTYVSTHVSNGSSTYEVYEIWDRQIDAPCDPTNGIGGALKCKGNDGFAGSFAVPTGVTSYTKTISSGSATPSFRAAAVTGHILSLPDNGLKPETYTVWANSGCSSFNWQEACANTDAYFGLSTGVGHKDTTLEKFVIAHELGHQVESHAYGIFAVNYNGGVPDPTAPVSCRCDFVVSANSWHCLQSRHDFSTAHTEGFAHFNSQHAFNRTDKADCTFVYYKEVRDDQAVVHTPPNPVSCATPVKWLENHCVKADSGTEWDMLEFLRAANTGTDALSMAEILAVHANARSSVYTLTWAATQAAALAYFGNDANNPKYVHLMNAAAAAGVEH